MNTKDEVKELLTSYREERVGSALVYLLKNNAGLRSMIDKEIELMKQAEQKINSGNWILAKDLINNLRYLSARSNEFFYIHGLRDGAKVDNYLSDAWLSHEIGSDIVHGVMDCFD